MLESILIPRQFNGPPGSGHGGYVAGAIAELIGGPAEVTLRSPPPLDRPMPVERAEGRLVVRDGETLIAEARPASLDLDVPPTPDPAAVTAAGTRFFEFKKDDFHLCFACGAGRREDEGLRLRSGPIDGGDVVAARWVPHPSFAGPDGRIPSRILWSALDCPGAWAVVRDSGVVMYLGRLTAEADGDLEPGTPCTVLGWPLGGEGRKAFAGTAIYDHTGRLRGRAKAVWFDMGKRL